MAETFNILGDPEVPSEKLKCIAVLRKAFPARHMIQTISNGSVVHHSCK